MYAAYAVAVFAAIVFVAHMPILPLLRIYNSDVPFKGEATASLLGAWLRSILMIVPDLLAPVVVPIALLFTRWEDDHLPRFFWMWDNDASINGDRRTDDVNDGLFGWALKQVPLDKNSQEAIDMCYYAPGHHPRSFYARWVWLGLRNRASALAVALGKEVVEPSVLYNENEFQMIWFSTNGVWRFYEMLPITDSLAIRMHCGYKFPLIPGSTRAPAVSIGFSLRRNSSLRLKEL